MGRIVTPSQNQISNAYKHKLFDFDPSDYKQYISSTINDLLKVVGQHVILDGLDYTLSFTGTTVTATFSTGQVLVDNMYIDITESIDLVYDDANLKSDDGVFVAVLNYQHLQSLENNPARISFYYLSSDNVLDPVLSSSRDVVVLGIFDFTLQNSLITSFTKSSNYKITFNNIEYYLGGYNINNMNLTKLFENITEFQSVISFLREGNADVSYSKINGNITQLTFETPLGNVVVDYTYNNANDQIATELLTFRDVLLNTKTYTYDALGNLISWVEI